MGFLQDIAVPETEVLLCWKENKRKQQKKFSPELCKWTRLYHRPVPKRLMLVPKKNKHQRSGKTKSAQHLPVLKQQWFWLLPFLIMWLDTFIILNSSCLTGLLFSQSLIESSVWEAAKEQDVQTPSFSCRKSPSATLRARRATDPQT